MLRCIDYLPTCVILSLVFVLHGLLFWVVDIWPGSRSHIEERAQVLYLAPSSRQQVKVLTWHEKHPFFSHAPHRRVDQVAAWTLSVDAQPDEDAASSSMWWRFLPLHEPLLPSGHAWEEGAPKVFWRGEIASYVREEVPIKMKRQWHVASACTVRYRLQVDLRHGTLVCMQPIEENVESSVANAIRKGLWQQRFSRSDAGGIACGEVELCWGGEYDE